MLICEHSRFALLGKYGPPRSTSSTFGRSASLLGFLNPIIDIRDPIEVLNNCLTRWARFKSGATPKGAPCPISQRQFVLVAFRAILFAEYHLYLGLISSFQSIEVRAVRCSTFGLGFGCSSVALWIAAAGIKVAGSTFSTYEHTI